MPVCQYVCMSPCLTVAVSLSSMAAGRLGGGEDAHGARHVPRRDPEAAQEVAEAPGLHGRARPEQRVAGQD